MRFRSRQIEIEAVQLCWKNWGEVCKFLGDIISPSNPAREVSTFSDTCGEPGPTYIELTIPTLEGNRPVRHGEWIIKGTIGEFYPCKPDAFAFKYEPVEEKELK